MKRDSYLLILIITFILIGCKKDDVPVPAEIQDDFKIYVDRFISEGSKRGVKVDLSGYKVSYGDTLKYYCGYAFYDKKQVIIRYDCWQGLTDLDKEILMFHELGHAYLGRNHNNNLLENGDYKTMMFNGNQFGLYAEYSIEKRKYYLDELFNSSISSPVWAVQKNTPKIIFQDSISTASNNWTFINTANSLQIGELSSEVFSSASKSLSIRATSPSTLSYWVSRLTPQNIKQSTKLTLTVKIKLDEVTDGGVYIALRGDDNSNNFFFNTTRGNKKIIGTTDFVEYSVDVPYYIDATKKISVFLIMDSRAIGTVYFDDVTLINYE